MHLVSAVLVGGVDTTQAQLAHGIRLFAEHPDQWQMLAEDPSLAAAAAEEALRYEPITPFTARITLEDVEYRDVTFPKGTLVVACSATANRDPGEYEQPERFDITADRERSKPLTFGAGPALLPRRQPGPRRAPGGLRVPRAAHARPRARRRARLRHAVRDLRAGQPAGPLRLT